MDMSVAKCIDCYVKLEQVPCSYYPGGIAYRCPHCKLEYTKVMYENFVQHYKDMYGDEFTMGQLFDEDVQKKDIIILGTPADIEVMSDEIKKLLSEDGPNTATDDNVDIEAYEMPIQEA